MYQYILYICKCTQSFCIFDFGLDLIVLNHQPYYPKPMNMESKNLFRDCFCCVFIVKLSN